METKKEKRLSLDIIKIKNVWLQLIYRFTDMGLTMAVYFWFLYILRTKITLQTTLIISIIVLFKYISYEIFGLYRSLINDPGLVDALRISLLVSATNICAFLVIYILQMTHTIEFEFPVSSFIFTTCAEAVILVFTRFIYRLVRLGFSKDRNARRTLIIGAGSGGKVVYDEIHNNKLFNNKVVAFIDDNDSKIGHNFIGRPVYGPIKDCGKIIERFNIDEVIIAIANLTKVQIKQIIALLANENVTLKRLPILSEMSIDSQERIKPVSIDELLGREPILFDNQGIKEFIKGKRVLITGAGGSIGSELCRQIFSFGPSEMILFDIYENGVYDVQQDLKRKMIADGITDIRISTIIGATYNYDRMDEVFNEFKPELIFHAAAYKHVPLMEDSPVEAIRSNVIGTYNVAKLVDKYKSLKMVLVSTDKAVRPTSTMGATKRFAEMIIQYFDSISQSSYSAVRFGNVLGSNGSVIPLFERQILEGGPVTVTDPNIIRYFMTIPEAVSLILQSGAYATGGEIFILDMGKPVKIVDLAKKLILSMGYIPDKDIMIEYCGLRPGEKLYEELLIDVSHNIKTENAKIFIEEKEKVQPIEEDIVKISRVFKLHEIHEIKEMLQEIVTNYKITDNK